jgi:hypothetical protein
MPLSASIVSLITIGIPHNLGPHGFSDGSKISFMMTIT